MIGILGGDCWIRGGNGGGEGLRTTGGILMDGIRRAGLEVNIVGFGTCICEVGTVSDSSNCLQRFSNRVRSKDLI